MHRDTVSKKKAYGVRFPTRFNRPLRPISTPTSRRRIAQAHDLPANRMARPPVIGRFRTPSVFASLPILLDTLKTETLEAELEVARNCLKYLTGTHPDLTASRLRSDGLPSLEIEDHREFLHEALGDHPAPFVVIDASRPFMIYWSLAGLAILGEDVTTYRERLVATLAPCQNKNGGFGGGPGQYSHCAVSYAAILSLCIVGGESAWNLVDRKAMWHWLGHMKQADGGFSLAAGGEEDIRGGFCATVIISLLNLPLDLPAESPARANGHKTFIDGLPEWIGRCQSFEGGLAGSPGNEAHGAYAFCAIACLSIIGEPKDTIDRYLHVPSLLDWMTSRQMAPEGGFSGRTNKLVDGCYSHWVGGCWPLIEVAVSSATGSLWNSEGLRRYIHCCCQGDQGGLRDKPGKPPDAYHSCYVLAGLSATQHRVCHDPQRCRIFEGSLNAPFAWTLQEANAEERSPISPRDLAEDLHPFHPVFVVPFNSVEDMRLHFEEQQKL